MKLYTMAEIGRVIVAVSVDGGRKAFDTEALGFSFGDMNDLILQAEENPSLLQRLKDAASGAKDGEIDVANSMLLSPIVYPMQDLICLGINYDEHAREAGSFSGESFGGERPYTIYFSKRVNMAVGPGEMIPSHKELVDSLDYECELGVIIGRDAYKVKAEDFVDYVFGYTIVNDVTARNLQTRHKQWYFGKSLDGFTPMGPCIVTPDEIGDPADLKISSYVNGELRQNSNTKYMIQTVGGAIEELSAGMTLKAGSIIAMGTPAGVGMGFKPPKFMKSGDTVRCSIEKIGDLENKVE